MMYLDASFFIYALLDQTDRGATARGIQQDIVSGKSLAVTSVLVLDECMWVLLKNKKAHLLRRAIEDIYAMPNLSIQEVQPLVPLRAIDFMEKFQLKPRDAFHLASMEHLHVLTIVSDDRGFDKVPTITRIPLSKTI